MSQSLTGITLITWLMLAACGSPQKADVNLTVDSDTSVGGDTDTDTAPQLPSALLFDGERPTNILYLSIDTLQIQRMGRYSGDDTTPFLDDLMAQSLVLDEHRSCSNWTYVSVICALAGRDPMEVGHMPTGQSEPIAMPDGTRMMSTFLRERGYATALITANPYLGTKWGPTEAVDIEHAVSGVNADEIIALGLEAADSLAADPDTPWFLHLHFLDPHLPYAPPPAYLAELTTLEPLDWDLSETAQINAMSNAYYSLDAETQQLIQQHLDVRYAGGLRYMDDQLAGVFAEMEARGYLEDTLVVLWSDHGEQIYEREKLGHGHTLYDIENAALAVFWSPNLTAGSWTGHTTHRDLVPTVWDAMGWSAEPEFTGAPAGRAPAARSTFGITYQEQLTFQSIVEGDYKLIYTWTGELALYNLAQDPEELNNLYIDERGRARDMWERLSPQVDRLYAEFYPDGSAPIPPR